MLAQMNRFTGGRDATAPGTDEPVAKAYPREWRSQVSSRCWRARHQLSKGWRPSPPQFVLIAFVMIAVYKLFLAPVAERSITDHPLFNAVARASRYDEIRCSRVDLGVGASAAASGSPSGVTVSKAIAGAFAGHRARRLVLAESNTGFAALTENWRRHWERIEPGSTSQQAAGGDESAHEQPAARALVVALDPPEHNRLISAGVPTWMGGEGHGADSAKFSQGAQGFFSGGYRSIVFNKWQILSQAMGAGRWGSSATRAPAGGAGGDSAAHSIDGVLLTDIDVLPFRNPFAYISTLPLCDAYFTTESAAVPFAGAPTASGVVGHHGHSSGSQCSSGGGSGGGRVRGRENVGARSASNLAGEIASDAGNGSPSSSADGGEVWYPHGDEAGNGLIGSAKRWFTGWPDHDGSLAIGQMQGAAVDADGFVDSDGESLAVELVPGGWHASSSLITNYFNTGFLYLRNTSATRTFVAAVTRRLEKLQGAEKNGKQTDYDGDQPIANEVFELMRRRALAAGQPVLNVQDLSNPSAPLCARYGDFSFWVLNPFMFQNGKHAWEMGNGPAMCGDAVGDGGTWSNRSPVDRLQAGSGLGGAIREPPFTRHYNYLGGSVESKVAAMKLDGSWQLDEDEEARLSCRSFTGKAT